MILKPDCRHFPGDRPCAPSKEKGKECPTCDEYRPGGPRVLLVKLDAPGDVLRTACVLPGLRKRFGDAVQITWITRPASVGLLKRVPGIDRVLSTEDAATAACLSVESFDLAAALDPAKEAAALATAARAGERRGFVLHAQGYVLPADEAATPWFEMGAFDRLKKANIRTYQDHVQAMLGLDRAPGALAYRLGLEGEKARALIPSGAKVVGFNTGAGSRWKYKKWTEEGWLALAARLRKRGLRVALLGGPEEKERNDRLAARLNGNVLRPGEGFSLDGFAGLLSRCDAVVTGDTLALHLVLALQRRVVALFGPTSSAEVELYGLGEKVVADIPCKVCYLPDCDVRPTCMDLITPERVEEAVLRQVPA